MKFGFVSYEVMAPSTCTLHQPKVLLRIHMLQKSTLRQCLVNAILDRMIEGSIKFQCFIVMHVVYV